MMNYNSSTSILNVRELDKTSSNEDLENKPKFFSSQVITLLALLLPLSRVTSTLPTSPLNISESNISTVTSFTVNLSQRRITKDRHYSFIDDGNLTKDDLILED
jgi:hypothetical protein